MLTHFSDKAGTLEPGDVTDSDGVHAGTTTKPCLSRHFVPFWTLALT